MIFAEPPPGAIRHSHLVMRTTVRFHRRLIRDVEVAVAPWKT